MAKEIDLSTPFVPQNDILPGRLSSHSETAKDPDTAPKPDFNPMRRKLGMPLVP